MSPRIFESFGYPIDSRSEEARSRRAEAHCCFMQSDCDGGGNRFLSNIDLRERFHASLAAVFPGKQEVPSAVCSIQVKDGEQPWIVCPRRLLYLGRQATGEFQPEVLKTLQGLLRQLYPAGTALGIWSECKVKHHFDNHEEGDDDDADASFDYTFDYVLCPTADVDVSLVQKMTGLSGAELQARLKKGMYEVVSGKVLAFPTGSPPFILEIMTSSTSGGNKKTRTTIKAAFEDAMLSRTHQAPGINYRQVWARMASQLIVKSQVGIAWGGRTLWVLQDVLAEYISATTGLRLPSMQSQSLSEVNILSVGYWDPTRHPDAGPHAIARPTLFAGPIRPRSASATPSFQDIVLAGRIPPVQKLFQVLSAKPRVGSLSL